MDGHEMNRSRLLKILVSLGKRSGVSDVHPHRFRHTFAIQYLRNGGDPYTLQALLGHSSLDLVKVYLRIAQIDIDTAHRRASPVDNWKLWSDFRLWILARGGGFSHPTEPSFIQREQIK